jgi:PLD-like domain
MPPSVSNQSGALSVKAYAGDCKTLLAFNLDETQIADLAGFTIQCRPHGRTSYYLLNSLQFETPSAHAQVPGELPNSSVNAPFHKFRWLHVPGSAHQGLKPLFGRYTFVVTPRYFESGSMQPLDPALSVSVDIDVVPFEKGNLGIGFTRGFVQSQAFVRHFGENARIRPSGHDLVFDTTQVSGTNAENEQYTFADEYEWLGFTARERVFALLDEVVADPTLHVDVFAYDLNEPDLVAKLLDLANQGRIRVILDDAALHHSADKPKPEDDFQQRFTEAATGSAGILRGSFGRYAHDKIIIVSENGSATKVLTGSTNFSVTGLYVNSNHVLVFDDPAVAEEYAKVFQTAWDGEVARAAFVATDLARDTFSVDNADTPSTQITFSPHEKKVAQEILGGLVTRIQDEPTHAHPSVLFAVMELGGEPPDPERNPVYAALRRLHDDQSIFSYGISDSTDGMELYVPRHPGGVLVTGKPTHVRLPPPFNQVPGVGLGHQIHHKFVVCGFNGDDPVVYCGSSNLALGGEQENGDNLLAIRDPDVATAFAIEAPALVDHFDFLDRMSTSSNRDKNTPPPAANEEAAVAAGWFLTTDGNWAKSYYDQTDLHCADRLLFA